MPFNILVELVLNPCITETHWLSSGVEVLKIGLDVLLVLDLESLCKLLVYVDEFSLVNRLLLVKVVHDEEIFSLVRRNIDAVNLVEIWLTVIDHISEMISVTEDVLTWVHKHFHLVCNQNLQGNQKDVFLLIEDHCHISELETFVFVTLKWNSIKLILGTCLVVMGPNLVIPLKDLDHLLLSLQQVLVV